MNNTYDVVTNCPFCRAKNIVTVDKGAYDAWQSGALIQNAMPTMGVDDRELLMTGICNDCFPS